MDTVFALKLYSKINDGLLIGRYMEISPAMVFDNIHDAYDLWRTEYPQYVLVANNLVDISKLDKYAIILENKMVRRESKRIYSARGF